MIDQNVNPGNGTEPEYDEFGIPIKRKKVETAKQEYDEFGIPIKKKELSGGGSPAVLPTSAAKSAAMAKVASPEPKAQPQDLSQRAADIAKGSVSGLGAMSPSTSKSTFVSDGSKTKAVSEVTPSDFDKMMRRIELNLTPGGNIPKQGQKTIEQTIKEAGGEKTEPYKTLGEKALEPTWETSQGKAEILKTRYERLKKEMQPELDRIETIKNLENQKEQTRKQIEAYGTKYAGQTIPNEAMAEMTALSDRLAQLDESIKFEKFTAEQKMKALSTSEAISYMQAGGNRILGGLSSLVKGPAVMMSSDNDVLEGLSWAVMPMAKLGWELFKPENATPKDNPLYQLGTLIDNWRKDHEHINPLVEDRFSYQLTTALTGDLPLYMGAGMLGGAAGVSMLGAFDNGVSEYEIARKKTFDANSMTLDEFVNAYSNEDGSNQYNSIMTYEKLKGQNPEEVGSKMFLLAGAVGTLEGLPFVNWLNKFDKRTGGFVSKYFAKRGITDFVVAFEKSAVNPLAQGIEEAAQEGMSEYLTNVSANEIYDATREVTEGLDEASAVGFGMGFIMGSLKTGMGRLNDRLANAKGNERVEIERSLALLSEYERMLKGERGSIDGPKTIEAKRKLNAIEDKLAKGSLSQTEANALTEAKEKAEKEYKAAKDSDLDKVSVEGKVIQLEEKAAAVSDVAPEQAANFLEEASRLKAEMSAKPVVAETAEVAPVAPTAEVVSAPTVASPENIQQRQKETEDKIKRKDLFGGVGEFSTQLGGSDKAAVPVSHREKDGIEVVEYAHPETGSVDVIVTGTTENDYVGYYRIYENGKPTNRWSSKMANKSGDKNAFKTMVTEVQALLPEGHEYTETTNISLDGVRVYANNLNRGYEILLDENGKPVTNNVSLNKATLELLQGAKTQEEINDLFDRKTGVTKEEFDKIKAKVNELMPNVQLMHNLANGSVIIKLPVLKKTATTPSPTVASPTQESQALPLQEGVESQAMGVQQVVGEATQAKSIVDDTKVITSSTTEGNKRFDDTIGNDVDELDADPRFVQNGVTRKDRDGNVVKDTNGLMGKTAFYRTIKGKSGKNYISVTLPTSDAAGREGGASVILEMTGEMTPEMESALLDLNVNSYKESEESNVVKKDGLERFKADVVGILSGKQPAQNLASPETAKKVGDATQANPALADVESTAKALERKKAVIVKRKEEEELSYNNLENVLKNNIEKLIGEEINVNTKQNTAGLKVFIKDKNGNNIFTVTFQKMNKNTYEPGVLHTNEKYRRKGIASKVYEISNNYLNINEKAIIKTKDSNFVTIVDGVNVKSAGRMWDSMVNKGIAKKEGASYEMINSVDAKYDAELAAVEQLLASPETETQKKDDTENKLGMGGEAVLPGAKTESGTEAVEAVPEVGGEASKTATTEKVASPKVRETRFQKARRAELEKRREKQRKEEEATAKKNEILTLKERYNILSQKEKRGDVGKAIMEKLQKKADEGGFFPKFVGEGKVVILKDGNIVKRDAVKTEAEEKAAKAEQKKKETEVKNKRPVSAYEAVVQFFANGGKINTDEFIAETGFSKERAETELKKRKGMLSPDAQSIDKIAMSLAEKMGVGEETYAEVQEEIRQELISSMLDFNNQKEATDELLYLNRDIEAEMEAEGQAQIEYEAIKRGEVPESMGVPGADVGAKTRVEELEAEVEASAAKLKELWKANRDAFLGSGVSSDGMWKKIGDTNADMFKEAINYVYGYAKLTGAKIQEAVKRLNNEFFEGLLNEDEILASPEIQEAYDKGIAERNMGPIEEAMTEETETGDKRVKSVEKRVVEGGSKDRTVIDELIDTGLDYVTENWDAARRKASRIAKAYRSVYGEAWKSQAYNDIRNGKFDTVNGAMRTFLFDELISNSEGTEKAVYIKALSDRLRSVGREISAAYAVYMNSPEGLYHVALGQFRGSFRNKMNSGKKGETNADKAKKVAKQIGKAKKEAVKDAAAEVSQNVSSPTFITPKERKARGKAKMQSGLNKMRNALLNGNLGITPLESEFKNKGKFYEGLVEYAEGLIDSGVSTVEELVEKMKEAISEIGINKDDFDAVREQFLSDINFEEKVRLADVGKNAEKLAKKIVNRAKAQPATKKTDAVKIMIDTLFRKAEEMMPKRDKQGSRLTTEQKIRMALEGYSEYQDVWNESKDEVLEQIDALEITEEEKVNMISILNDYFENEIGIPFAEGLGKKFIFDKYKRKTVRALLDNYLASGVDFEIAKDEILERIAVIYGIKMDSVLSLFDKFITEEAQNWKDKRLSDAENKKAIVKKIDDLALAESVRQKGKGQNSPVWSERKKSIVQGLAKKLKEQTGIFGNPIKGKEKTILQKFGEDLRRNIISTFPKMEKFATEQNSIELIGDVLLNQDIYANVIKSTQENLLEQYKDNPEALAILDEYFAGVNDFSFAEKQIQNVFESEVKAKELNLKQILQSSDEIQASTKEDFIQQLTDRVVAGTGLDAAMAKRVAERFEKLYDQKLKEKGYQLLNQMFPQTFKRKSKKLSENERLINAVKYGLFDGVNLSRKDADGNIIEESALDLFMEKFGFPDLTDPVLQAKIKDFADAVTSMPEGSQQRRTMEKEFALFIKWIKNDDTIAHSLLGASYGGILFDPNTMTNIFRGNMLAGLNSLFTIAQRKFFTEKVGRSKDWMVFLDTLSKGGKIGQIAGVSGQATALTEVKGSIRGQGVRRTETSISYKSAEIRAKYAKTALGRAFWKFKRISGNVIEALDAAVVEPMTDIRYADFVLDKLNKENARLRKDQRKTQAELREIASIILGNKETIIQQAERETIDEFEKMYGEDFKLTGEQLILFRKRVEEKTREIGIEEADRMEKEGRPIWEGYTDEDLQALWDEATKVASEIGMVGNPPGTLGLVVSNFKTLAEAFMPTEFIFRFLGAITFSLDFVFRASPVGIIPLLKNSLASKNILFKNRRGVTFGSQKTADSFKQRKVRDYYFGHEGKLERREAVARWLTFQAMTLTFVAISMPSAFKVIQNAITGLFDDEEKKYDPEKAGKALRDEYFGVNYNGGNWKDKSLFVTGRLFGTKGKNYQKSIDFSKATGVQPYTVYMYGNPMGNYLSDPTLMALFGFTGIVTDAMMFNDKIDEADAGMLVNATVDQMMLLADASPMANISELVNVFTSRKEFSDATKTWQEKHAKYWIKKISDETRNTVLPRMILTVENNAEAILNQSQRVHTKWYEFALQDWPLLNNLLDPEVKTDHFGTPIPKQTTLKSPFFVQALDYRNGEIVSPFLNDVEAGPNSDLYQLFYSKNSTAHRFADTRTQKFYTPNAEIEYYEMDNKEFTIYNRKVSEKLGKWLRSEKATTQTWAQYLATLPGNELAPVDKKRVDVSFAPKEKEKEEDDVKTFDKVVAAQKLQFKKEVLKEMFPDKVLRVK